MDLAARCVTTNHFLKIKNQIKDMKKIIRDPVLVFFILLVFVTVFLFIVLPLYKVIIQSVISENGSFTLEGYLRVFKYSDNIRAIWNSVFLGCVVGILATMIGFLFSYSSVYIKMSGKKIFDLVAMLPIISPPFAVALSIILLFGSRGLITYNVLGIRNFNIYGLKGLIFVQTLTFFPISYLLLNGMIRGIDPSMEEASMNLGGSRWETFRKVTVPLVSPGLINSFILVFISSIADFGNPMTIGGNFPTMATQVYLQAIGNYDMQGGAAIATVLLNISIILFIVSKYWIEKKVYITVTGKAARERVMIEEKHIRYPIAAGVYLLSGIVLLLYVLIPLGSFVKLWGINYSLTLDHYKYALSVGTKAILQTTWLSLIAMPITGILGMVIAFLIVRKRFIGRNLIDFTSMLCIAVPGTIIGIGYILAFNSKPIAITGTAAILVIALVARSIPLSIRAGISSLQQIDPGIEEAAADLGAGSAKVFTSVTIPLIKTAFFGGLVYSFIRSMTAISGVIFLISARYNFLTVQILDQVETGKFGVASAFSTILILIVYLMILILYKLIGFVGVSKKDVKFV